MALSERTTSPTGQRFYRPGLDVLRCLAFLMVFNLHGLPRNPTDSFTILGNIQEFGAGGVCLFFTLSAFLITELLLREAEGTGSINLRSFYIRRILRIWPLYIFMLLAGIVFPLFYLRFPSGLPFLLPYLFMSGNWALIYFGLTKNVILAPLWSISVEEQFYVLWPTLFRKWRARGILAAVMIILPLAWAADYLIPFLHLPTNHPYVWCNSLSQFQFFALGGAAALFLHKRPTRLRPAISALAVAAAVALFALSAYPFHGLRADPAPSPGHSLATYLCLDLGCVLFLAGFLDLRASRFLNPFVYLGKISYGLYVYHLFLLAMVAHFVEGHLHTSARNQQLISWLVTLALVIPLASLSYTFFEKPFLRFKERFTVVKSRPA